MRLYWLWLASRPGMTEREKMAVLLHFGSPEDCYYADAAAFRGIGNLSKSALEALCDKDLQEAEAIVAACEKKKIHILTFGDEAYPSMLRNIIDPPLVLYYRGVLPDFDRELAIGIVGTRKASAYGLSTARKLGRQIAAYGGLVVSGMAEGIDAMAIWGALDAGKTAVGVLGNGVDRVYPRCNRELYRKMEQKGCLISEYPPGTAPDRWNFPKRNRIISGLSCGVLVVEAPQKSGALITARQALEQGRDVFVVPGNIGISTCEGSNALLKDGAALVTSGWDVVGEYAARYPDKIQKEIPPARQADDKIVVDNAMPTLYSDLENIAADLSDTEREVLAVIGTQEQLIDTVIAKTGLSSQDVLAALTMLEVSGYVTTRPGGWVEASQNH